ncbi:MAG: MATE family efflux transporter [Bacteroidales bacterium]|nr:MATE family efflux transporter [Bacteroidales bacterium]
MIEYKDERQRQLATKPVGRLLIQFATPSIIAMSASSIYNLCDSIFIGRGAGPLAIAGLAITFPLMNISAAFGAMLGVGSAAQTSVKMGEGNQQRALMIFGNMLRLDITIGLIITTLGLLFLDPILRLFGASDATLPYAHDYMQIILAGNIVTHTFLGMNDQLRATGNPRRAMTAQLMAVVINIILDALFIFGFGWGMRGAALATVMGQICAWIFEFRFFLEKSNFVHFARIGMRVRMDIIREILAIGLSPFCVNLCHCLIVIIINRSLIAQGGAEGDSYVGVYGIVNRVSLLIIMMVMGFGQGLQPIVGFNIGAKLYGRVRGVMKFALACATTVMTLGYLIVFLFPGPLASLFTTDTDMVNKCIPALRIIMCTFTLVGPQMMTMSFFQSSRRAGIAILLSTSRQLLFLLPLLLFLPRMLGVYGVWWSFPISDLLSFLLAAFFLLREFRRLKRL